MEIGAYSLIWIVKVLVWALLLFNAYRLRLVGRYPLVFTMILALMAGEFLMGSLKLLIGPFNLTYTWAWVGQSLVTDLLILCVLLQTYSLPEKFSIRKDWPLALLATVLFCVGLLGDQQLWLPSRLVVAFELLVALLGVATIIRILRTKNFRLGWNLRMVLLAVTVPTVFTQLVFNSYLIRMLSHETANLWLAGAGLAAWIVLAAGMTEYSPPVFITKSKTDSLDTGFAKTTSTRNLG